jgi:hypothetical protein
VFRLGFLQTQVLRVIQQLSKDLKSDVNSLFLCACVPAHLHFLKC